MEILKENIIGEIVATDYRTAAVFNNLGIDFCCKGNRSIEDACLKDNIDTKQLIDNLNNIDDVKTDKFYDFLSWDLDLLADYIEKVHHRYVENKIPEIKNYLSKMVNAHGAKHPEILEIDSLFNTMSENLTEHMNNEEATVFPYIKEMIQSERDKVAINKEAYKAVISAMKNMKEEHENEGERIKKIAQLSNNFTPPEDACNTYKVGYALLQEFEQDLYLHIHLENNILFHKTSKKEKQ